MSDAPIQSYRDILLTEEAYRFTQRVLDDIGSPTALLDQCDAVGKMLHGQIRSLQ